MSEQQFEHAVMDFLKLRKFNVNEHTEKKGNLTYLSWAWAVDALLQHDPMATWEFPEPKYYGDTVMVYCNVTAFGKTMRMQLPVMDNKNHAISNPDARKISDATMRCLAKCIACFGIALYIYAGEDLPEFDAEDGIKELNACTTLDQLQSIYKRLFAEAQGNQSTLKTLTAVKDNMKAKLGATS